MKFEVSALTYLAQRDPRPCPKGEHLKQTTPVVCVPNKEPAEESTFLGLDQRVIDTGIALITLAVLILAAAAAASPQARS